MASNFPTSLDSATQQPSPSSGTGLDASGFEHDVVHGNHSTALIAVETKLGTGDSNAADATANTVLVANGSGGSAWSAVATGVTSVGTLSSLTVTGDLTVDTSTLKVDSTNNRVGVGTSAPDKALTVDATADADEAIRITNSQESGTGSTFIGMTPLGSGPGDTYPGIKFGAEEYDSADRRAHMTFWTRGSNTDVAPAERMRITSDGNVQIGGSTQPGTDAPLYVEDPGNAQGVSVYVNTSTTTKVCYKAYSNIGGTEALKFDVRADGDVNYDGVLTDTSDVRLKTDIEDTDLGLGFINELRPVSYRRTDGVRRHYGLIAQEVAEVLGDDASDNAIWVQRADLEEGESSVENPQGLRYNHLIAPLIKAVQELTARLEALEGP